MKRKYTLFLLIFILAFFNFNAQTEFRKDSIHLFQWDNTNDNWKHNTREYLTYDDGGSNETNLRRQFLSGNTWANYYQFNKVYTTSDLLEENIQQNWNSPNAGWNDKYKHVYLFESNQNEIEHQYFLYNNGVWGNYQKETKDYVNNYLNTKTQYQYNSVLMEFVPEKQFLYNYSDNLLDFEIHQIYFPDFGVWDNDEKIEYTYNINNQHKNIEYFGFNATTGMFSESPYKKTVITYTSEGLIEGSITQLWASSEYVNTERFLYSYTNENLTELVMQNWSTTLGDWVNSYRHVKTYDSNDNEIEFIYENWNIAMEPNEWKGFLRIVNFWSESETLEVNNYEKNASVSVYPNPATHYLNILSKEPILSVELYNLLGKQVLKTTQTEHIDISNLDSGMFLLKLSSDHTHTIKKLIIK